MRHWLCVMSVFAAMAPVAGQGQATPPPTAAPPARPSVLERPWTSDEQSPYGRAQAVAAERLTQGGIVTGTSPYPDEYRSAVPGPFQPAPPSSYWWDGYYSAGPSAYWGAGIGYPGRTTSPRWRGGRIYPALPFRPIQVR